VTDLASTASDGRPFPDRPDYRDQLRTELKADRLVRLGAITVEFALIVVAVRLLNIESWSFEQVLTLAFGGFLVNHFLPAAWRLTFFAGLSITSVLLIFGWHQGAWLLAMGGILIALCHLPVALPARIALILLVAAAMALEREQLMPWGSSVPSTIWPILGAMFMFRLIVYLYDLANRAAPFSPARAVGYFFMLPNVCFPLFPVVDYKTLQRSVYNDDPLRLYQTGAKWMLRGLLHLMLYKVVYFLFVIDPAEITTGTGAARYMVSTYLLYLKISGLFHLIIGLLRMYGFGLAETHHLYLFASSFTDFWRRINIYWKDFIQKLVFNPIYFATKRLGATGSLVVATLVAFTATWLFHSYQWFWIRGTFPIVWSDLVFWFGLGLVVTVNVLIETHFGRRRSLGHEKRTLRQDAILGLKIAGTFAAICVLWTIWSTPEVEDLGFVWRAMLNSGPGDIAVLAGVPLLVGVLGVLFGGRKRETSGKAAQAAEADATFWRQAATVAAGAAALILIALRPGVLAPVSPELAGLARNARQGIILNAADAERLQRGYYEDLGDVNRFDDELWAILGGRPADWNYSVQDRRRDDAIAIDLVPSSVAEFKGATRTVNSHGMRDREYSVVPGPDTFRIALIGSSHDMGEGVEDDQTYENLAEDRLNAELGPRTGLTYEILNFSRGAITPTQKLAMVEKRMLAFEPDLILYAATNREIFSMFELAQIQHLAQHGLIDEFPYVAAAIDRAGVEADLEELVSDGTNPRRRRSLRKSIATALGPYAEGALEELLETFRDLGDGRDVETALLLVEVPDDNATWLVGVLERLHTIGEAVGLPVIDLQGALAAVPDQTTLWITSWDAHINPLGHRLLADRLYTLLIEQELVPTEEAAADD
jgi:hypothetical protein